MSFYNDDLEYASLLIQEGRKEEASRLVRDYLDTNPDDPDGWYLFAAAAPIPEYAVRHLQRALDIDPFHAKARAAMPKVQAALERAQAEPPPPPPRWRIILRRTVMTIVVVVIVVVVGWLLLMFQSSRAEEQTALATARVIMTLVASGPTPIVTQAVLATVPPPVLYETAADPEAWANLAGTPGDVARQGDRLILTGMDANVFTSQFVAGQTFSDGMFIVDVSKVSGPLNDGSGLAVRVDPEQGDFYLFLVSSDGYAAAFYCEGWCSAGLTEIVPWTPVDAINQGVGAVNTVAVTAAGADFQFEVNGVPVAGFTDERRSEGGIGVGTFVFEAGPSTVAFEGLRVQLP